MNLIIFMALLGEFKGLPIEKTAAQPICDKVYDFIRTEDTSGRRFDWSICENDIGCSELSYYADAYLDECD